MKQKLMLYEKADPYINRFKSTSNSIRAKELVPDCDENQISEGNKLLEDNYSDPDFFLNNDNLKKAFNGNYPFDYILSMSHPKDIEILYLYYEKSLSIKGISKVLNIPVSSSKLKLKYAHDNFYLNLRRFGRMQMKFNKGNS